MTPRDPAAIVADLTRLAAAKPDWSPRLKDKLWTQIDRLLDELLAQRT